MINPEESEVEMLKAEVKELKQTIHKLNQRVEELEKVRVKNRMNRLSV